MSKKIEKLNVLTNKWEDTNLPLPSYSITEIVNGKIKHNRPFDIPFPRETKIKKEKRIQPTY